MKRQHLTPILRPCFSHNWVENSKNAEIICSPIMPLRGAK